MPTVHVNGKQFSAEIGETLSHFFLRYRLIHPHPCGGLGTCLACRIRAVGQLSLPSEKELRSLSPSQLADGFRLSCQTRILGDASVELLPQSGAAVDWESMQTYQSEPTDGLGLAVDIGTTTCAFALINLNSGLILGREAFFNPQISFGRDVLSRISYTDTHPEDISRMQKLLVEQIENAALSLCRAADRDPCEIRRFVCVGNTVMLHYLAGIDPSPIGKFPYTPPTLFDREYSAADLGFSHILSADIYLPPCIGGYIGADIAAGLLLLPVHDSSYVFADLGTNGEIASFSPEHGYLFTSAAAGPAFEGSGISCGMPAAKGAVIDIVRKDGRWDFTVLGQAAPQGVCGSGLLDILAALLSEKRLSPEGRLISLGDKNDPVSFTKGEAVCYLTDNIFLTQKDIYQLLLAKAAIAASLDTVFAYQPTETLYIGGGFGKHLNLHSAIRVGLFGSHTYRAVKPMGNTALGGAVTLLLSPSTRASLPAAFSKHRLLESAGDPTFDSLFIEHLTFSTERM